LDIPRIFNITESARRIHNPFTPEKLAALGAASGNRLFTEQAKLRAEELGVADQVKFIYEAAKWLTMRRWLDANPDDEREKEVRAKLTSEPARYAAYTREYLGWGVYALMTR
jgi:hypothetical protein